MGTAMKAHHTAVVFFTAALLTPSLVAQSGPSHCIVSTSYHYCIENTSGWTGTESQRRCRMARAVLRAGACPRAAQQGACRVDYRSPKRTLTFFYYEKTWTQMSVQSMQTGCRDWETANSTAVWVPGSASDPNAKEPSADSQFPFEAVSSLRVGSRILAPRAGDDRVWPAVVIQMKSSRGQCAIVRFNDYKTGYLRYSARVQPNYWEVGTPIECRRGTQFARGRWESIMKGTVKFEDGTVAEVKPADCRSAEPYRYDARDAVCPAS